MIKHLSVNSTGRDFVCGDIHGSYSCVIRFLKEINFDETKDRLICAGDLIDRGPQNEECLELLYRPWFYLVKGNHEEFMHTYFDGIQPGRGWWANNGGIWGIEHKSGLSDQSITVKDAAEMMKDLPYLITVEKRDGKKFHVIHAELALHDLKCQLSDDDLTEESEVFKSIMSAQTYDGISILWARYLFYMFYKRPITDELITVVKNSYKRYRDIFNKNLSPIFSGHTIVRAPIQFFGQTNLDTMAYASYKGRSEYEEPPEWCGLTVTEPLTGKFWLVNDRVFKEVKPVIIE